MMSSSGFQPVNGLRLWVHRFRDESAPPSGLTVVLVHGFLDAGATWDMVARPLARAGHDVVAPDLRGFGLSDFVGPGGYYHFPDYVSDLAELIDALAPRRLALVGHSMGGTVAVLYAGAHPGRVERLALLEGLGPMATEPHVAVERMQAWLRTRREVPRFPKPLTSLQEAIERLALHHPRVPREVIESRAKLLTRADDTGRLVWAYDPLHRTTAPTPFNADAFKEFLRRIDCPTLVVSGGASGWHPPDEADRVTYMAHVVRFELPHAGHMMHWTEPGALADRLAAFFGEPPVQKTHAPTRSQIGTELSLSAVTAMPPPSSGNGGREGGG
jgi:pimeloyl-ACP methyl ester carboxylesterase